MITATPGKPGNLEARNREVPLSRRDLCNSAEIASENVQVIEVLRISNYKVFRAYATRVGRPLEFPGFFQVFQGVAS
ncbi:hypothetical protein QLQ78_gp54 [Gordonia phage Jojo24]|uniref:Uncharacterized protein n=1 Tax=Gordonia phage Jojo24 TaxID=2859476 RepID=A0AAE7SUD5_9CAUD|nr:hypothetical protein QLQ78_gp54 [Gordonia phage Jojo24]QXO13151.1 hypothetical protein SEA_JOJO24_54 [Gordonia phage Jojo24]